MSDVMILFTVSKLPFNHSPGSQQRDKSHWTPQTPSPHCIHRHPERKSTHPSGCRIRLRATQEESDAAPRTSQTWRINLFHWSWARTSAHAGKINNRSIFLHYLSNNINIYHIIFLVILSSMGDGRNKACSHLGITGGEELVENAHLRVIS